MVKKAEPMMLGYNKEGMEQAGNVLGKFFMFIVGVFGFLMLIIGLVLSSIPSVITGVFILALSIISFCFINKSKGG